MTISNSSSKAPKEGSRDPTSQQNGGLSVGEKPILATDTCGTQAEKHVDVPAEFDRPSRTQTRLNYSDLPPPQLTDIGASLDVKHRDLDRDDLVGSVDASGDEENLDVNTVWWTGQHDPENPMNWPMWRKSLTCVLISVLTFVTPLASSIFAPAVPALMEDFSSDSKALAAFVVSVYLLGFSFGPLVIAPLSEIYGRNIVYHCCNMGFILFLVGCALAPTLGSLIAFRFMSGIL